MTYLHQKTYSFPIAAENSFSAADKLTPGSWKLISFGIDEISLV